MVVMFVLTVYQHRIQQVSDAGILIWVPKLMKNSLEKASLIQILGAKIFIGIGSKHCKKFSITIPLCFF